MENKLTHDTIVGSGLANNFINLMKLEGWLPIEDYFAMRNNGIELDWVTVLTMEMMDSLQFQQWLNIVFHIQIVD